MSEYKVIRDIWVGGNHMVIIKDHKSSCVVGYAEWKKIYGRQRHEHWSSNNVDNKVVA